MQYALSPQADRDIEEIYDYTRAEFGADQAVAYLQRFYSLFHTLQDNPGLGRPRPEIRTGLRSVVLESHVVFYRVYDERLRIVRVLHGSRDLQWLLDTQP